MRLPSPRRELLRLSLASLATLAPLSLPSSPLWTAAAAAAVAPPELHFETSSSGLQWADAKLGSGSPFSTGSRVAIDYVMSTTGARYGSKIDSTLDRQASPSMRDCSWETGLGRVADPTIPSQPAVQRAAGTMLQRSVDALV